MHCPHCLEKKNFSKIISLTPHLYVCEENECNLILSEEEFNNLSKYFAHTANDTNVNIDNNDENQVDTNISANTDEITFDQLVELQMNIAVDSPVKTVQNVVTKAKKRKKTEDDAQYSNNGKSDKPICPPKTVVKNQSKKQIFNESSGQQNQTKIINMLKALNLMSLESKVVCAMTLHLGLFPHENETIKMRYAILSALANRSNFEAIRPMFYDFTIEKMQIFESIFTNPKDSIDKRIKSILCQLLDKVDPDGDKKCEYSSIISSCGNCGASFNEDYCDYFITMLYNIKYFRMRQKKFVYTIDCAKCGKNVVKHVPISDIPNFLVIYCPKGIKYQISQFQKDICLKNGVKSLVSVIECRSYKQANSRDKEDVNIHIRYKNGWHTMVQSGPDLSSPSAQLNVSYSLNVRFLVYANLDDLWSGLQSFSFDEFASKLNLNVTTDAETTETNGSQNCPKQTTNNETAEYELVTSEEVITDDNSSESSNSTQHKICHHIPDASIHSQTTASSYENETDGASNDSNWSFGIDNAPPDEVSNVFQGTYTTDTADETMTSVSQPICPSPLYQFSSSGVSSCSSNLGLSKCTATSSALQYTESISDTSSSTGLSILTQKRRLDLDDLIIRKRSKILFC